MADSAIARQVEWARKWIGSLRGWRRAVAAIVFGSLSILAFAPFCVTPILFLTLPALVWLIDNTAGPSQAARTGWLFGFGYFFFSLLWIGEAFLVDAEKFAALAPFAVTLLPAGLAIFWALAIALARRFWWPGLARVLVLAVALAGAEWLRGHLLTGLPWNVLGYALTQPDSMMQSASLIGVYALGLPVVILFAWPLVALGHRRTLVQAIAPTLAALGLIWGFGTWRLAIATAETVPGVRFRIVQPSVPQREKWLPEFQARIFQDHLTLSQTSPYGAPDGLQGITHVVWPEAAMPFLPLERPEVLTAIGGMLPQGRQLITGALRRVASASGTLSAPARGYNSIMVFKDDGGLASTYDKIHLVPFGEYLPLSGILGALGLSQLAHGPGAFSTGAEPRPLMSIAGLPPAAGLICYEVLFPGAIVQTAQRPGVMLNVTNDGWFGTTIGPPAHFHQARVRAVEEGLPLIRAANNGISGVIDPYGRVIQSLALNVRGVADSALPVALPGTCYAFIGDYGLLILSILAIALAARNARNSGEIDCFNATTSPAVDGWHSCT